MLAAWGLDKRACLEPMPSGAGTQQSRPLSVIWGMQGFLLCDWLDTVSVETC